MWIGPIFSSTREDNDLCLAGPGIVINDCIDHMQRSLSERGVDSSSQGIMQRQHATNPTPMRRKFVASPSPASYREVQTIMSVGTRSRPLVIENGLRHIRSLQMLSQPCNRRRSKPFRGKVLVRLTRIPPDRLPNTPARYLSAANRFSPTCLTASRFKQSLTVLDPS